MSDHDHDDDSDLVECENCNESFDASEGYPPEEATFVDYVCPLCGHWAL